MKKARIWKARIFRLRENGAGFLESSIQRIPPRVRFWLSFLAVVLLSAYLVTKRSLSFGVESLSFLGLIPAFIVVYFAVYRASSHEKSLRINRETVFWVVSTLLLLELLIIRAAEFIAVMLTRSSEMNTYSGYLGFELRRRGAGQVG